MPAAIPIIAAVAAGSAAAAGLYAVAAVITIAGAVAAMALAKKQSGSGYRDQSERKQVLRAAASPKTVVYGETQTSGTLFFSEEEPGEQEKGEKLYLAITMAGHKLTSVSHIYLADELIGSYGTHAEYELHNDRNTADPYLLQYAPSWQQDMIGRGVAWLRLTLKFDAEKFPAGIPNVKVQKKGWAVYDPRTGREAYSNNAALVILHYYRHYLKVDDSEINWDQFQEAANISDEWVACGDGSTEPRYTINGEWDLSEKKSSVLEDLLAACAGDPTYIGGKHGLLVGAYYGPALDEINEDQLAGDIEIMPEVAQSDRVNTIKGTFIDPQQGFSEVDFPVVSVAEWVAEDGVEIAEDLKLRFVSSEFQAQRLADIKLKRTRIARTMNLPLNLSGYRYRPGMYVLVNLPSIGISGVEMRVTDWAFSIEKGVMLTVKQESAEVWNNAIGKPITRPPLIGLPTGGVAQPQSLVYIVEEIGDVVQGVLSWQNTGTVAYNLIVIRHGGDMVMSVQVPGSTTRLSGLLRGTYTAHVTAVNFMGARSPEAWIEFIIQAPDAPSYVRIEQGYFAVTLYPQLAQLTSVSTQFDFWTSGLFRLDDSATPTVEKHATRAGIGRYWSSHGLLNDKTYYWYVRSINAFGASAFTEVIAVCSTDTGLLLDFIDQGIRDSETWKNLTGKIDTSITGILENALNLNATVDHQFAQYGEIRADIITVRTTIATVSQALAEMETQVQAGMGDLNSAINQKLTAVVNDDGTAKAFYTLRVGITRRGAYYGAGMAVGVEPAGNSYKSTLVFNADQFGIYTGNDAGNFQMAFAAVNGQVFINDVFINYASITLAKVKSWYSANYVPGKSGTIMNADGSFEMNGDAGTGGGSVLNARGLGVYDPAGVERFFAGRLR